MSDQILKDRNGHIIGKIVKKGIYLEIQNKHGHAKGRYDTQTNRTLDKHGHLVGHGNLLTTLLE